MDFLDPAAKKRRAIRMAIGYALMGILIAIATTILVFQSYGFDVDRKTGEVIQNGLVFIDSAPDKATIYLNDQVQNDQTNSRLTRPEGHYSLLIRKDGYRDWRRSFELKGGDILRFTYPLLLPVNLEQQEIFNYPAAPGFASESPDRRWLLVSKGASINEYLEYDLKDVAIATEKPIERPVTFPADLFAKSEGAHSIELVEWSNDNKNVLVKHNYKDGHEFILLNREDPALSLNINKHLNLTPTSLTLRDKKFDQWYLYMKDGGLLQTADTTKTVIPILNGVGTYKSHDTDTIIYSQPVVNSATQRIFLKQGKDVNLLLEVSTGVSMLDIARYDGSWFVAVGSDTDKKTFVYRDPQTTLKRGDGRRPAPVAVLRSGGAALTQVSFSTNTRFILAQSGQHLEVYDAEENETLRYDVPGTFDPSNKLVWMDGHRLLAHRDGKLLMFDFDGSNQQELIPVLPTRQVFFDRDYTVLYTLNGSSATKDTFGLIRTDLRFKQDR